MADKNIKIKYEVEYVDLEKANELFTRIAKSSEKADKEVQDLSKSSKKAGDQTSSSFKKANTEADKLSKTTKVANASLNQLGGAAARVGASMAAAFTIGALVNVGRDVLNITAEFQKFEAVLTNSLGSNSKAQIALLQIQDFAAKTPFSVRELTEAYVQLANRGITPSTASLTKVGDLASALGKPLSQVNEAILDVTNSERWTELGVKVKVSGDKIIGTFRGMTVEAEKSEAGALKMVEAFGEMQGVAGGMAKVSETLGGKISNLGDSMDQLYVTIGNLTGGAASWFIESFSEMAQVATRLLKSTEQLNKEAHLKNIGKEVEELSGRYNLLVEDVKKYQNLDEAEAKTAAYKQLKEEFEQIIKLRRDELLLMDASTEEFRITKQGMELAQAQLDALEKLNSKRKETAQTELGLLEKLRKELKEVTEAREKATSEKEIQGYNKRAKQIQAEIDRLIGVGKAAERAKIALERLAAVDFTTGLTEYGEKVKKALSDVYNKIYGEQVSGAKESSEANQKASDQFIDNVSKQINARATQYNQELADQQRLEAEERARYERKVELAQEYTATVQDLYSNLVQYQSQLDQQRIEKLEANKERELKAAGDNTKEKNRIELEYDAKLRDIRRKQAEREKRLAIFNALVNIAQGVTKAIAQGGVAGIVLGALVAAAGAAQIAAINSQQIPAYAKGTKSVPGKGNKDSEHAMLTPGEMVIPVATKKKYNPILDAIFDHKIDPKVLNDIVTGRSGGSQILVVKADNKELLDFWKDKPINNFSFDEDGFNVFQEKGRSRTKYLTKRYSSR